MATKQSHDSDEGAFTELVNFDRCPSPSLASHPELGLDPDNSSTTLVTYRTRSPVQNSSDDDTQENTIKSLNPVSAANENRRHSLHLSILRDVWLKEILSMSLSIGCIIAVAVILQSQNNEALSSWPLPWQPSSVVSFMTTISRAALIFPLASCISQFKWHHFRKTSRQLADLQYFDAASRGPLGSLSFIFKVTFKTRAIIASLCCIFTIAALAMDTFVQQTIEYQTQPVLVEQIPCTAKVSQSYSFGKSPEDAYMMLSNMAKAIRTGIFGQTPFQTLTCPTANCTWTDLTTMGLCSSCENVTLTTKQDCYFERYQHTENRFSYHTVCVYTTPQGVTLVGNDIHDPDRENMPDSPGQHWTTLLGMASKSNDTYMNMSIVRNPMQLQADSRVHNKKLEVFECRLDLCARTFPRVAFENGEIRNGESIEHALSFENNNSVGLLLSRGPTGNAGSAKYNFSRPEAWGLTGTLALLFSQPFDQQSWIGLKSTYQNLDHCTYIYDSDDIPRLFNDMALAITDYLRTVDPIDVPGKSFQNVTFVQVHWPWLIGPLLIELGAAALLTCCIAISARQKRLAGTQIWKDSVFPFLFNGIEREKLDGLDELAKRSGRGDCAPDMEARARRVHVRLQREEEEEGGEGRLRFV